jgi:hypothetical protein
LAGKEEFAVFIWKWEFIVATIIVSSIVYFVERKDPKLGVILGSELFDLLIVGGAMLLAIIAILIKILLRNQTQGKKKLMKKIKKDS